MSTGSIIRELRIKNKMSQKEVADHLGLTDRSTVSKMEHDVQDISQSTIFALAKLFNVRPSELIGDDAARQEPIFERPGMRALFKKASSCTDEQILQMLDMLEEMADGNKE